MGDPVAADLSSALPVPAMVLAQTQAPRVKGCVGDALAHQLPVAPQSISKQFSAVTAGMSSGRLGVHYLLGLGAKFKYHQVLRGDVGERPGVLITSSLSRGPEKVTSE